VGVDLENQFQSYRLVFDEAVFKKWRKSRSNSRRNPIMICSYCKFPEVRLACVSNRFARNDKLNSTVCLAS
jgi:hypothetical protein